MLVSSKYFVLQLPTQSVLLACFKKPLNDLCGLLPHGSSIWSHNLCWLASATLKICISPQFWASDEHEVTRGLSPAATYQTYPAEKKRRNFKEEQHFKRSSIFEEQPFSAALLSSSSQQLFSAALLSSLSQQLFSAAFLSSSSQQLFSAAFLSSSSQQLFSAALLSSSSQQPFLSSYSQQPFLSYHLAVVRGWWSASSLSQQLFSAALLSSFS